MTFLPGLTCYDAELFGKNSVFPTKSSPGSLSEHEVEQAESQQTPTAPSKLPRHGSYATLRMNMQPYAMHKPSCITAGQGV